MNNLKLELDAETLLKLCKDDKRLEIVVQKAAMNYIKNNRLKPILKSELVEEIEKYKKNLRGEVKNILINMGFYSKKFYFDNEEITLPDGVRKLITKQAEKMVEIEVQLAIAKQVSQLTDTINTFISNQKECIRKKVESVLDTKNFMTIVKTIISEKLK